MNEELDSLRNILKDTRLKLHEQANVIATGIGYKITKEKKTSTLCIVCSVIKKLTAPQLSGKDLVPSTIDGVPTDVVETGPIRALSYTGRYRPAPGGVSIGHMDITAGTLGCLVKRDGKKHILSNNHVLADSNNGQPGDYILQPGPYDGGEFPGDRIAKLEDFVPISFLDQPPDGCGIARAFASLLNFGAKVIGSKTRLQSTTIRQAENLVDAALALPIDEKDVSDEILDIGKIKGVNEGAVGMAIKKTGRTTEFTTGEILQVDVTVDVQYELGKIARFTDQLMGGAMSEGGDSGSALLDTDNNLVGLLFAGSDTTTIFNRIQNVFSALGVSL
ncbi:MAG: hypothetical protein GTO17_01900 [Candidatus Aminicenantes bacterium]|nr:hypothetical protein [Candidatus Aminicenantes bacterium]